MPFKDNEAKKAWRRAYRAANRDKHKAWSEKYEKKRNPDRESLRADREHEKDMAALKWVIDREKKRILKQTSFVCRGCGKRMDAHKRARVKECVCVPCRSKEAAKWKKANPESHKESTRRFRRKIKMDPAKRMIQRYRQLTSKHARRAGVQGEVKGRKLEYLGCTAAELVAYLQNHFTRGMTWDNYGRIKGVRCWEIDHIKPLTAFDLSDEGERRAAFHYTNLQPMWSKQNIRKGNRVWPSQHQPSLLL